MIDLIEVMQGTKAGYCRSDGAYTELIPQDKATGFGKLLQVKNQQGYPVDVILFNDVGMWDRVTERDKPGWTNPRDIKLHTGSNGRGTYIGERFVKRGFPTEAVITPVASYEPFYNGQVDLTPFNVGRSKTVWQFTDQVDWGGEVGKRPAYIRNFYWGGKVTGDVAVYSELEVYIYPPPFGLIDWTEYVLNTVTGVYEFKQSPGRFNTTKIMAAKPPVNCPLLKL